MYIVAVCRGEGSGGGSYVRAARVVLAWNRWSAQIF